jgi:hypothetical protein
MKELLTVKKVVSGIALCSSDSVKEFTMDLPEEHIGNGKSFILKPGNELELTQDELGCRIRCNQSDKELVLFLIETDDGLEIEETYVVKK